VVCFSLHTCGNGSVCTDTVDFVVRVDKKLWVGSGLSKNCNSLFSTQCAVVGCKSFDCTDRVALSDDAAGAQVVPPKQLNGYTQPSQQVCLHKGCSGLAAAVTQTTVLLLLLCLHAKKALLSQAFLSCTLFRMLQSTW